MPTITVPGASADTIPLSFATQTNATLAQAILASVYGAYSVPGALRVADAFAGSSPTIAAGQVGDFLVDAAGIRSVPAGFSAVTVDNAAATISAGTALNLAVVSGNAGMTFLGGSGSGTVVAGGGDNMILGPSSGGGTYTVALDGAGNTTAYLTSGNWTVSTDDAASTGMLFLGSGQNLVTAAGSQTVIGGAGASTVIASGARAVIYGGTGTLVEIDSGGSDMVSTGTGASTVFAAGNNDTVYGGGGPIVFVNDGAGNLVLNGSSNMIAFGGGSAYDSGVYFVGTADASDAGAYFYLVAQASQSIVVSEAGGLPAVVFGGPGSNTTFFGPNNNLFIATDGNETLNSAYATGNNTYYAGSGDIAILVGAGDNTVVGGSGTLSLYLTPNAPSPQMLDIIRGAAGGVINIAGTGNNTVPDEIDFYGYAASDATVATAGGSTTVTLSDNTRITLLGNTNPSTTVKLVYSIV